MSARAWRFAALGVVTSQLPSCFEVGLEVFRGFTFANETAFESPIQAANVASMNNPLFMNVVIDFSCFSILKNLCPSVIKRSDWSEAQGWRITQKQPSVSRQFRHDKSVPPRKSALEIGSQIPIAAHRERRPRRVPQDLFCISTSGCQHETRDAFR